MGILLAALILAAGAPHYDAPSAASGGGGAHPSGTTLSLDDNIFLYFGDDNDFAMRYNAGASIWALSAGASTLLVGISATPTLAVADDVLHAYGTSLDYWYEYNSTGTQLELWSTSVDGGGTDGLIFSVDDGDAGIDFTGQTTHVTNDVTCATGTDDFDIDWNDGNIAVLDMEDCDQDANDVNAPTNPVNNAVYTIVIEQSTAGTEDLTWNAVFLWPGGTAPVLTQTNNARDLVSCVYADTIYHCSFGQDYQ